MESLADGFDDSAEARVRYRMVVNEPSVHGRALDLQSAWEDQIARVARVAYFPGPDPMYQSHVVTATALACLRTAAHVSTTGATGLRELLDRSFVALDAADRGAAPAPLTRDRCDRGAAGRTRGPPACVHAGGEGDRCGRHASGRHELLAHDPALVDLPVAETARPSPGAPP